MRRGLCAGVLTMAAAAGCASAQPSVPGAAAQLADAAKPGASCARASVARPLGATRASATIALARLGSKRVAFVADEDARAVIAVDVDTKKELATTALPGVPGQLLVMSDGRVLVALRDRAEVAAFVAEKDSGALTAACVAPAPAEPIALAATPDDKTVLVASGFGHTLRAYEASSLARAYDVDLPREPRAVVVSDDGATAFVSHAAGAVISAVDLKGSQHSVQRLAMRGGEAGELRSARLQRTAFDQALAEPNLPEESRKLIVENQKRLMSRLRAGVQGFALAKSVAPAGRILAPQVMVDPGDPERRTEGYGESQQDTEAASIAVVDEVAVKTFESSLTLVRTDRVFGKRDARDHRDECLLPRAAAVDARSHSLLVACFGIDAVIAYDSASANPQSSERRRFTVGSGPTGIAVDPDKPQAFVWSQFDRAVHVLPLSEPELPLHVDETPQRVAKIALAPSANKVPTELALGRVIFHAGSDSRISKDGRACASCHPDGRDDGLTWATPDGPRRSILLAGRVAKTAPYSWSGQTKTLHEHITKTFDRLDGTGLRSLELDALVAYIQSLRPPAEAVAPKSDAKVARGAVIFASKEAACGTCHHGAGELADGVAHDVQSKTKTDVTSKFDTPSLRFVGGTGPYFHDGRYADLRTLLRDADGKMGRTKHLSEADLDALEAYVRTL